MQGNEGKRIFLPRIQRGDDAFLVDPRRKRTHRGESHNGVGEHATLFGLRTLEDRGGTETDR